MLSFKRSMCAAALGMAVLSTISASAQSDEEIKREIIKASRAAYSGVCACPYDTMRNGKACNTRSAYARPGGARPVCYARDVTPEMSARHRQQRARRPAGP